MPTIPGTDLTTNAAFLLISFFLPVVITLCKQSGFTRQVNALIALAVYIASGVLAVVLSGEPVNMETIVPHCIAAMVVGRAAYSMFWNTLGASDESGVGSIDERLTVASSLIKAKPAP